MEALRAEAFGPVFESFRRLLGEEIYEWAQRREDEGQGAYLASLFSGNTTWELFVAENEDGILGFVSWKLDQSTGVGEIGLNAVWPSLAGQGIGTQMYDFALTAMKSAGMKVAVVSTGGDASHVPARRAYEKAGFDVSIPSVWMCRTL